MTIKKYTEVSMLSHEEMVGIQAERHDLIDVNDFSNLENITLHLLHIKSYEQAAQLAKNRIVLDLGCNTGYGSNILHKTAGKVYGVDVSQKAITSAVKQLGGSGIVFKIIDGKRLPFPDGTFDLIVSFQVIEHIVNYESFLSEIRRVLSPRGIVMLSTPNAVLRLDAGMKPWNPFHVKEFTQKSILELLNIYFKHVKIYGLFATDSIYSVERQRILKFRENARKNQESKRSLPQSIRRKIKGFLPAKLLVSIRRLLDLFNRRKRAGSRALHEEVFNDLYTTKDIFYKHDDFDNALDLLALCCNKESVECSVPTENEGVL